jgi:type 1 fimbria pilin
MKIYGLKIYESDVLVKDYRPTVTNGVSGLVDVANPEDSPRYAITYGHSNPRLMFEAGGDIACTDGSDEAYLEFNGTYIDTGCTVASNSCVEADLSFREVNNGEGQYVLWQEPAVNSGVVAYLYLSGETSQVFNYRFADCDNYSGYTTGLRVSNERRQFTLDGPNYKMTIRRGNVVDYDLSLPSAQGYLTRVDGGSATMKIGNSKNHMRLYRFKVTTGGVPVRDFVPCCTNGVAGLYDLCGKRFYPLAGGKVSGAKSKGVAFQIEPQPMTLKYSGARRTGTLTCLAAGAQSYEWYENGVLMPGETSDSLALEWSEAKARSANNTYTYSVKPVYTVFNERVVGDAATTTVEYRSPKGMLICIH